MIGQWIIGITVYRLPAMLEFMLESVAPLNQEILIVDDGSLERNRIREVAKSFGATYIQHDTNKGLSATTNSILQYGRDSNKDYLSILNHDLYLPYQLPLLEELEWLMSEGYSMVSPSVWGLCHDWEQLPQTRGLMDKFKRELPGNHNNIQFYKNRLDIPYKNHGGFHEYAKFFYNNNKPKVNIGGIAGSFIAMSTKVARIIPNLSEDMHRADGQDLVLNSYAHPDRLGFGKGPAALGYMYIHHWAAIRTIVDKL